MDHTGDLSEVVERSCVAARLDLTRERDGKDRGAAPAREQRICCANRDIDRHILIGLILDDDRKLERVAPGDGYPHRNARGRAAALL